MSDSIFVDISDSPRLSLNEVKKLRYRLFLRKVHGKRITTTEWHYVFNYQNLTSFIKFSKTIINQQFVNANWTNLQFATVCAKFIIIITFCKHAVRQYVPVS
jgi:hypothetical protein